MNIGLAWPIVSRFRRYVEGLPDGGVHAVGTTLRADRFDFPFSHQDETTIAYRGRVDFTGHSGFLHVSIEDPEITLHDGEALITIADDFEELRGRMSFARGAFAREVVDGVVVLVIAEPRLTDESCDLFNGAYASGALIDPIVASFPDGRHPIAAR